jgi:drug/metabolite transporter (DMT)-like permease
MHSKFSTYVLLLLMPLLFSSNVLIGRASAGLVQPWTLAFGRWSIAALILLPFALGGMIAAWDRLRAAALDIFILGVYISLHYTTATNAALIYNSSSLLIVLMDAFYFGKRLTWLRIAGLLIGFIGVAVIVLNGDLERLRSFEFNVGDIGILIAAISWAIYSVMLKREKVKELPTLTLFASVAIVGALCLLPFVLFEILSTGIVPATGVAWLTILSLALIPGVGAYGVFQLIVKRVGPSLAAIFFYLTPVFGVLAAILLLGEQFHAYHAVGMVLVIAGVAIATGPFNRTDGQKT